MKTRQKTDNHTIKKEQKYEIARLDTRYVGI